MQNSHNISVQNYCLELISSLIYNDLLIFLEYFKKKFIEKQQLNTAELTDFAVLWKLFPKKAVVTSISEPTMEIENIKNTMISKTVAAFTEEYPELLAGLKSLEDTHPLLNLVKQYKNDSQFIVQMLKTKFGTVTNDNDFVYGLDHKNAYNIFLKFIKNNFDHDYAKLGRNSNQNEMFSTKYEINLVFRSILDNNAEAKSLIDDYKSLSQHEFAKQVTLDLIESLKKLSGDTLLKLRIAYETHNSERIKNIFSINMQDLNDKEWININNRFKFPDYNNLANNVYQDVLNCAAFYYEAERYRQIESLTNPLVYSTNKDQLIDFIFSFYEQNSTQEKILTAAFRAIVANTNNVNDYFAIFVRQSIIRLNTIHREIQNFIAPGFSYEQGMVFLNDIQYSLEKYFSISIGKKTIITLDEEASKYIDIKYTKEKLEQTIDHDFIFTLAKNLAKNNDISIAGIHNYLDAENKIRELIKHLEESLCALREIHIDLRGTYPENNYEQNNANRLRP